DPRSGVSIRDSSGRVTRPLSPGSPIRGGAVIATSTSGTRPGVIAITFSVVCHAACRAIATACRLGAGRRGPDGYSACRGIRENSMQVLSRQRGISLIEVMMAVLIFSIGLIGLASLMVMATRSNHAAYLRTQVVFLANSTAYPVSASSSSCGSGSACDADALATYDQSAWSSQLKTFLPNPVATIN